MHFIDEQMSPDTQKHLYLYIYKCKLISAKGSLSCKFLNNILTNANQDSVRENHSCNCLSIYINANQDQVRGSNLLQFFISILTNAN